MPHAIRIPRTGGPEVLRWEEVNVGAARRRAKRAFATPRSASTTSTPTNAAGCTSCRCPSGIGTEAPAWSRRSAGRDRRRRRAIASRYSGGAARRLAEARVMPAERLVKLPDGVSDRVAATPDAEGPHRAVPVPPDATCSRRGETILFHAAAGGVGLIACQWARALGVTMIGTVGSDEKAALAKAHGCAHTIVYTRENFVERVKEITGGKGVPVVYDVDRQGHVSRPRSIAFSRAACS